MESSNRQESGNLSVFFTGALFGAGIALLLAPQAGAQMRRLLGDYVARAKDELYDTIDHGIEALDDAVEHGRPVSRNESFPFSTKSWPCSTASSSASIP